MMSAHEILALGHPRIAAFQKFYSEYHLFFEVGAERFRVSIRIYETNDGRFLFEQSHYIRTPVQDVAQGAALETHAGAHLALSRAVESITTYYDEAVGKGQEPSASWFLRNEAF